MTLVEFLAPLKDGKHQDRILAAMYYRERYEDKSSMTVEEIRTTLKIARVQKWAKINVADVLSKSGHLVDTSEAKGKSRLWKLTDSGRKQVREILGLPGADVEIEHDVGTIEGLVTKLSDPDVRDYLNEAIKCLKVGALRSCVVFVWSGAIRSIHSELIAKGANEVTSAVQRVDAKAPRIKTIDDFAYVKDATVLLAAKDLGILDKNEKDVLTEALNLRNRSGHPGKYRPGVKKVSAFIEDVASTIFA